MLDWLASTSSQIQCDTGCTRVGLSTRFAIGILFARLIEIAKSKSCAQNGRGNVKTQDALIKRDCKRAIIEERNLDPGVVCTCSEPADRRLGRPMRRPSRGPSFRKTPRVWSHGNGRGRCTDPNTTPYDEQLTDDGYEQTTAKYISHYMKVWNTFHMIVI
eukprot:6439242-Pyramimonas_sp.AAC.1